ncbi:MAG: TRAP transporter small permease [Syntrophales bacterium]|nr:TRAP transporter small permease [Syntrophales bacterium]
MALTDGFLEGVERLLKQVCLALVIGLSVLVFCSVFFRYLLNSPIEWADEVVGFFILGLTYFGSAVACGRRSQIYVEILESALKGKPDALRGIRIVTDTVTVITLALMVFVGFQLCIDSRAQKTGILLLSYFWVYLFMPVGASFMILMMIKRLRMDLRKGFRAEDPAAQ